MRKPATILGKRKHMPLFTVYNLIAVIRKHWMMNVLRAVLDTSPSATREKVAPAVADEGPQQGENSGGPLGTTLSKIDRLIANVAPEKNIEGTIPVETSARRKKELKKPLRRQKLRSTTPGRPIAFRRGYI
jgi:hypothetical protein